MTLTPAESLALDLERIAREVDATAERRAQEWCGWPAAQSPLRRAANLADQARALAHELAPDVSPQRLTALDLGRLSYQAHAVASELNAVACDELQAADDGRKRSCLVREREQPWKRQKSTPTHYQNPSRMCASCAAQWHATMAGILIDNLIRGGA